MDDLTSKRCRALIGAAHSDEPNAASLQRTAAALGIQTVVITTAATVSERASGAAQVSTAKATGATTVKVAGMATAVKGTGSGLHIAALGAGATVKLVSVAVLVAGGVVGVAQWDGWTAAPHATDPSAPETPNGVALPAPATGIFPADADSNSNGVSNTASNTVLPTEAATSEPFTDERREVPSHDHRRETPRKRTNTRASSPLEMSPNALEREVALLGKARAALVTSNPDIALKWLDQYQRQFTSGMLKHEAGVLRARARDAKRLRP